MDKQDKIFKDHVGFLILISALTALTSAISLVVSGGS